VVSEVLWRSMIDHILQDDIKTYKYNTEQHSTWLHTTETQLHDALPSLSPVQKTKIATHRMRIARDG
jgi:hypothetical protein